MERQLIFKKTRIAPTPSGYLHLGNILSFAITAALAKKTNAKLVLRIDDFDMERTNKMYIQDIFDTLNFLEIPWDEGPRNIDAYEKEYSQRHRMAIYIAALEQLKVQGNLFACTCSRAQVLSMGADNGYPGTCRNKGIPLNEKNVSWRIDTSEPKELRIKTLAGATTMSLPASMRDFIVKRKDGIPAYQLISVMDDAHYGIDLVVRGEDLWASTLAQQYLSQALGLHTFSDTTFYHHPLIMDALGNKLSKSEGATSVHYLRMEGKTRADIYALIAHTQGIKDTVNGWEELVAHLNIRF
jgi:glutamyl/glutaminyl-tRNA synthetase